MRTVKCPRCKAALGPEIYEGVDIDRCATCGGAWLDEGELKVIVNTHEKKFSPAEIKKARQESLPEGEVQDPEIACPLCAKKMERFNYACSSGIMLDKCPGHGIWLDKGELENVQILAEEAAKMLSSAKGAKKGGVLTVVLGWLR